MIAGHFLLFSVTKCVLNPVSDVIFSPHTGQHRFWLFQILTSFSRPLVLFSILLRHVPHNIPSIFIERVSFGGDFPESDDFGVCRVFQHDGIFPSKFLPRKAGSVATSTFRLSMWCQYLLAIHFLPLRLCLRQAHLHRHSKILWSTNPKISAETT